MTNDSRAKLRSKRARAKRLRERWLLRVRVFIHVLLNASRPRPPHAINSALRRAIHLGWFRLHESACTSESLRKVALAERLRKWWSHLLVVPRTDITVR